MVSADDGLGLKRRKAPAIMGVDAQKEAAGVDELLLGDLVQMRKTHPCGSKEWLVLRIGMDIKLRCLGCGHEIMAPRRKVEKSIRRIITEEENA